MLYGTRQLEVLGDVILPVHSEHGLALHAIVGVALKRDIHLRAGIDNALIENGHLAGIIVYRVVGALSQHYATCRHHNRTLRNVVGTGLYHVGRRATELSCKHILVLLGYLPRHGLGRVVELGEGIFGGTVGCHAILHKIVVHILAEGFGYGEEHTTVGHGIAFNVVEESVGVCLVVIVEAVGTEHLYDGLALHLGFGDIGEVHASRIALELDVEAELVALYRRSQIVDILHHKPPVGLLRIVARVLERLHKQRLRSVGVVSGKLAHLIGHAAVCVLIGNGKHLVGLQLCLERDVAEGSVDGILRRIEQTRLLKFLVVGTAIESRYGVERG